MDNAIKELIQYGAIGAICVFLMVSLFYLHKSHAKERQEWRETVAQQFEQTNKILSEMKGMFQATKFWKGGDGQ